MSLPNPLENPIFEATVFQYNPSNSSMMKKLLLLASVAFLGLSACKKTDCPAYSSTKAANRVSSSVTAATTTTPLARQ